MIVVSIIGLLAAILVPNVAHQWDYACQKATLSSMSGLQNELEFYKMDHGKYPSSLSALTTEKKKMGGAGDESYLSEIPADGWQEQFSYSGRDDGRSYELLSTGADRGRGGEDFDADIVATAGKKPKVEGS